MTVARDEKGAAVMTDAEFRMFAELLRRHCGLQFAADSRFLLEARVKRRMRELSLSSFAAYHYELGSGAAQGGELAQLIDEVTTNETYFFREIGQLRALVDEILPELLLERRDRAGGPVAVWSAGCASGEEPYSVVMLAEQAGLDPATELRVYASDISRRALRRARQGVYREASFRETDPGLRDRYFIAQDGHWKIRDEVKKRVDFIHINLMDRSKIALLGALDVILCRNVMIYFDPESKRRTIDTFEDKLRPGGHLLLGHSESLLNLSTSLELRHLTNDMVYRRPVPGLGTAAAWDAAARDAIAALGSEP